MRRQLSADARAMEKATTRVKAALLAGIMTLPTGMAHAVVDPIYECVVTGGNAKIVSESKVIRLNAGDMVRLRYAHVIVGYLPVTVKLPGGMTHKAKGLSSLFNQPGKGPRDTIRQLPTVATWTHYPSASSDKTIEIKLDRCERVLSF